MARDGWRIAQVISQRIAKTIAVQGPITIAEFMTIALLEPVFGYYAQHDPIGEKGDFITAPEISQMFGELIGAWLVQAWQDQGAPKNPLLVELGPGRGTLMDDVLRVLGRAPEFREAAEIVLVEASSPLRERQSRLLARHGKNLRWTRDLHSLPADRPLFLIANEFFDALPIRQFVKTERGWCERMVAANDAGALTFALAPTPLPAGTVTADRDGAPPGGVYEICRAGDAIAEELSHRIASRGGAALIVDYGYEAPGFGETLQAVASHSFADVLSDAGLNDLSAHVDFPALAAAARRGGAGVYGPVAQGTFLRALGIEARAERLGQAVAMNRLIAPDQMGTLFKALAIVPKAAPPPPGF